MAEQSFEEELKGMEGKQMPHLIGGENWWPERYMQEQKQAYVLEVLEGLRKHEIPIIPDYPQGFAGVPTIAIDRAIAKMKGDR